MEPIFIILIILGVVGLVVGIILTVRYFENKRTEALSEFAAELSLDFSAKQDDVLLETLKVFNLFNSGHSRKMKNVIKGETEIATIAIFDYTYVTGHGKHQTTHSQTVVAMKSDDLKIPSFTLRPESLFDWFGSALGFQDIDFEDHPQFSKMFVLKGENEAAIRLFFDTEILDFFAGRKGISFEAAPGMFVYFQGRSRKKPEMMRDYLNEGYSVYEAFVKRIDRGGSALGGRMTGGSQQISSELP